MSSIRSNVSLQIGLVSVPVNVSGAVDDDKETKFNVICVGADESHAHAASGIKQEQICVTCGNSDKATFRKGKIYPDHAEVFTDEQIAELGNVGEDVTKCMILSLHKREDIPDIQQVRVASPYWLTPSAAGSERIYASIVSVLESRPDIALFTEWAPRSKSALFEIIVIDGALAAQKVAWPEQVRSTPVVSAPAEDALVSQLDMLLDLNVTEFDPLNYTDTRKALVKEFLEANGSQPVGALVAASPKAPKAASLEDQLAAMVAATKEAKATPVKGAQAKAKATTSEAKAKPVKKSAPAKAPAKKVATKAS